MQADFTRVSAARSYSNLRRLGWMAMLVATGVGYPSALQADWPQFRGPLANPISDNPRLPTHWSNTENIEWSVEIPGRGWSSPIVSGDRIFFTTTLTDGDSKSPQTGTEFSNEYVAELTKQGLSQEEIVQKVTERDIELPSEVSVRYVLYCLDLKTGGEIWKREYHSGQPSGGRHRKNSFTSETPVTDGDSVFVLAGNMGLYCYDMQGELRWQQSLDPNPIYLEFGTGSSPVLCGERVLVASDNEKDSYLSAYDKASGQLAWSVARTADPEGQPLPLRSGWVTPLVWKNSVRTEIVWAGPDRTTSYDADGKELWSMRGMGMGLAASSFALGDQLLLNAGRGKAMHSVRAGASGDISLAAGESSNAFVAWTQPRTGTYIPSAVAYEGGLYIITDNGILTRLDLSTGETSYRKRLKGSAADFSASPWAYAGHVFFASEQGDVFVVKAGTEYELSHVNQVGELAMATPAIVGDRLLMRTDRRVMSIRASGTN